MKTIARKSNTSTTGYELVIVHDDGHEEVLPINSQPKNEPYTLILPENPSNRKYFNLKKIDNAGGSIELSYKPTTVLGSKENPTPKKGLEEYLEGEDKELYLKLVEKAKKKREESSELEKAMAAYQKALENLERLRGNKDNKDNKVINK